MSFEFQFSEVFNDLNNVWDHLHCICYNFRIESFYIKVPAIFLSYYFS